MECSRDRHRRATARFVPKRDRRAGSLRGSLQKCTLVRVVGQRRMVAIVPVLRCEALRLDDIDQQGHVHWNGYSSSLLLPLPQLTIPSLSLSVSISIKSRRIGVDFFFGLFVRVCVLLLMLLKVFRGERQTHIGFLLTFLGSDLHLIRRRREYDLARYVKPRYVTSTRRRRIYLPMSMFSMGAWCTCSM